MHQVFELLGFAVLLAFLWVPFTADGVTQLSASVCRHAQEDVMLPLCISLLFLPPLMGAALLTFAL